jgi:hypothetical protein
LAWDEWNDPPHAYLGLVILIILRISGSFAGAAEFYPGGDWTAPGGKDGGELMAGEARRWTLVARLSFREF